MRKRILVVRPAGPWYIARTPELDFVSQGTTTEEAKKNLLEVIQIQIQEMTQMGTWKSYLEDCGFHHDGSQTLKRFCNCNC